MYCDHAIIGLDDHDKLVCIQENSVFENTEIHWHKKGLNQMINLNDNLERPKWESHQRTCSRIQCKTDLT